MIGLEKYDFILVNYANADMIGHTGNKDACIEAVSYDSCRRGAPGMERAGR